MTHSAEEYIQCAKRHYEKEGSLEIDERSRISRGADGQGAYVQAWIWVADADLENRG